MGKIKGWTRSHNLRDPKRGEILYRSDYYGGGSVGIEPRTLGDKKYRVHITRNNKYMYFKTKVQAQAFAVRYMKAHPKG